MKYIVLLIYIGIALLNILKFGVIEKTLVNMGLSWTLSKILPYLTLLVVGLLIGRWFKRRIIFKVARMKKIVFWSVIFVPFIVGFVVNPIYQDDFSGGTELTDPKKLAEFRNADLVVIAMPGCPYCFESISAKLKPLKKRNPDMRIKFVVCPMDKSELKTSAYLDPYRKEGGTAIKVSKTVKNRDALVEIAEGRFPTFVMVKDNRPAYKWGNDQFGVRALDKLESETKK